MGTVQGEWLLLVWGHNSCSEASHDWDTQGSQVARHLAAVRSRGLTQAPGLVGLKGLCHGAMAEAAVRVQFGRALASTMPSGLAAADHLVAVTADHSLCK